MGIGPVAEFVKAEIVKLAIQMTVNIFYIIAHIQIFSPDDATGMTFAFI